MRSAVLALCCVLILKSAGAANIIGLFVVPSRSHHILGEAMMRGFAKAGHNVTLMSAFPVQNPPDNFTHIHIPEMIEPFEKMKSRLHNAKPWDMFFGIYEFQRNLIELPLESAGMKKLRSSGTKFDVLINEEFFNRVYYGLAYEFDAQVVAFSPSLSSYMNYVTGNSGPLSFVPSMMVSFTDRMTFLQRTINFLAGMVNHLMRVFLLVPTEEIFYKKYFKNVPDLDELTKNISLVLVNTHISLESPRPYVPNMIPIGGYHIQDQPKELPKDLKDYLDSAKKGFIYYSMGSNINPSAMSKDKILAFTRSFANVPYKVLWKWDTNEIPEISSNVKTQKWLPQRDILAHPNIKVFITHGGLLSTTEAILNGVPMIGILFFGDQNLNVKTVTAGGYGLAVYQDQLTSETLTAAIKEITENSKYTREVKKRQAVFLDRPMKPMDTAVYWVEHILRHGGGQHLRCAGADLNLAQYYLIDVMAFLFLTIFVIIKVLICSYRLCCCSKNPKGKSKKE